MRVRGNSPNCLDAEIGSIREASLRSLFRNRTSEVCHDHTRRKDQGVTLGRWLSDRACPRRAPACRCQAERRRHRTALSDHRRRRAHGNVPARTFRARDWAGESTGHSFVGRGLQVRALALFDAAQIARISQDDGCELLRPCRICKLCGSGPMCRPRFFSQLTQSCRCWTLSSCPIAVVGSHHDTND